jgi:hypothetical protein
MDIDDSPMDLDDTSGTANCGNKILSECDEADDNGLSASDPGDYGVLDLDKVSDVDEW